MNNQTPWDEVLSEILVFLPEYSKQVKAATPQKIHQLESCVGRLPDEYQRFLNVFGDDVGVKISSADFSIDAVLETYSDATWSPPNDLLMIGIQQDDEIGYHLCFSLRPQDYGRILGVYFGGDTVADQKNWQEESHYEWMSLQSMVFNSAFESYQIANSYDQHMFIARSSDTDLGELESIFHQLGYQRLALFDDWHRSYVSDSGDTIIFKRPMGIGNQVLFGTKDSTINSLEKFKRKLKISVNWNYIGTL